MELIEYIVVGVVIFVGSIAFGWMYHSQQKCAKVYDRVVSVKKHYEAKLIEAETEYQQLIGDKATCDSIETQTAHKKKICIMGALRAIGQIEGTDKNEQT